MRTNHILTGVLALSLLASCARKTEVNDPEVKPIAGKGGLTTVRISPKHFEKNVDSCTVYVKYNATAKPGNMTWDDSLNVKYEDGRPLAKFVSLKKGDYYFYGLGYDPDLDRAVDGGIPFTIIDTLESTYDIYLAVTPTR